MKAKVRDFNFVYKEMLPAYHLSHHKYRAQYRWMQVSAEHVGVYVAAAEECRF